MLQSGFIKRAKRTMYNIERHFIDKLVKKSLWRYMQFDPARYPKDMKFVVNSTMGMMAKEVENQQLIQMLSFTPPDSPAHGVVLQALFENAVSSHKTDLHKAVQAMNKPPTPEEQEEARQLKELQMRLQVAEAQTAEAEAQKEAALAKKAAAEAELALSRANYEDIKADLEDEKVTIQASNAAVAAEKARVTREQTNVARERNEIERIKARKDNSNSGL